MLRPSPSQPGCLSALPPAPASAHLPALQLWRGDVGAVDRQVSSAHTPSVRRLPPGRPAAVTHWALSSAMLRPPAGPQHPSPPLHPPPASFPAGLEPFSGLNYHALMLRLANPAEQLRPPLPGSSDWEGDPLAELAPGWSDLMQRCWAEDPTTRPAFPGAALGCIGPRMQAEQKQAHMHAEACKQSIKVPTRSACCPSCLPACRSDPGAARHGGRPESPPQQQRAQPGARLDGAAVLNEYARQPAPPA